MNRSAINAPVATAINDCSVHSDTRPRLAQHSAGHDRQPVADPEELGEIRADHDDGLALRGELADQAVDLGLGADVDPPRRLVEQEDVGPLMQEPRQRHLLLVSPGEAPMACVGPAALTRSRSIQRATSARRRLRFSQPQRE